MYCINCREPLPDNALFCHKCGKRQVVESVVTTQQGEGAAARKLRKGIFFLDNILAFVAVIVLTTITVILFAVGSQGFTMWDVAGSFQQFCMVGALAVSALASSRTGGLDLSVGGMMALSAVIFAFNAAEGNAVAGLVLALVVCGALGLLNGLFIMVVRVPAIFVTVASTMLIRGISMWASDGVPITIPAEWAEVDNTAVVITLLVSVGIAVFLLWRTGGFAKDGKSVFGDKKFFWIYGLIAVIGVLAGWATTVCFGSAREGIGAGSSNEMVLLFVFATLSASTLLKNNWIALGWVLLVALIWTVHDQAMILLHLNPFSMMVSNASWVFILLAVRSIANRSWKRPMRQAV